MDFKLSELKNALLAQVSKNDVVANNLANTNTVGFKKSVAFAEYMKAEGKAENTIKCVRDFSQGELQQTDNPLDFALSGTGFFTIESDGKEIYTRNGHFNVDRDGFLRTMNGKAVLGQGGWINIAPDGIQPGELNVNSDGEIYADGQMVGKFQICRFDPSVELRQLGNACFVPNDERAWPTTVEEPHIIQGRLEDSNVNPVDEMVQLVELHRNFESSQKTLQLLDDVLSKAANRISRVK